ncbi:hypothetical protein COPEUT_01057 [Coprococcus eutactus ATCC 27759]|nr:hypothetical protein COPEUT_01057 [Coprococcus eutactus ATCC 27759]
MPIISFLSSLRYGYDNITYINRQMKKTRRREKWIGEIL